MFQQRSGYPVIHPSSYLTHGEGALCAFTGALRQAASAQAGRDPASYPGAPVAVGAHHGLHGVAPDPHGSLKETGETEFEGKVKRVEKRNSCGK